jgi:hypothetical protein
LFDPPQRVIRGKKKPTLSGIRFIVPLPQFPIPEPLSKILHEDSNPTETFHDLKRILPTDNSSSAYWSGLLHIEEFQMM